MTETDSFTSPSVPASMPPQAPPVPKAPNVGVQLGAAGSPAEIICNGKTWRFGHPTQKAKERLEKLATAKAAHEIRRLKSDLDPATYDELFTALIDRITNGEYRTWKSGWHNTVTARDGSGFVLFLLSLLQEYHSQATEKDVEEIARYTPEEIRLAFAQLLPPFFLFLVETTDVGEEQKAGAREAMAALGEMLKAALATSRPLTVGS